MPGWSLPFPVVGMVSPLPTPIFFMFVFFFIAFFISGCGTIFADVTYLNVSDMLAFMSFIAPFYKGVGACIQAFPIVPFRLGCGSN